MHFDWPTLALGFGLGVIVSQSVTLPLLLKAWGAYRREQDNQTALRVAAILADIRHTQDASGAPDPIQSRIVADTLLFKLAAARKEVQKLSEWAAHVAAGGEPDDPPSKWMKGLTK